MHVVRLPYVTLFAASQSDSHRVRLPLVATSFSCLRLVEKYYFNTPEYFVSRLLR